MLTWFTDIYICGTRDKWINSLCADFSLSYLYFEKYKYIYIFYIVNMSADDLVTRGSQGISSHGIDLVFPEYFSLSNSKVLNNWSPVDVAEIFNMNFPIIFWWLVSWPFPVKLPSAKWQFLDDFYTFKARHAKLMIRTGDFSILFELIEAEWRIYASIINHHCFRQWLVAWPAPSQNLKQSWITVNWSLRNKPQWNLNRNSYIFIQENAFENVSGKIAAILSRPHMNNVYDNCICIYNLFVSILVSRSNFSWSIWLFAWNIILKIFEMTINSNVTFKSFRKLTSGFWSISNVLLSFSTFLWKIPSN